MQDFARLIEHIKKKYGQMSQTDQALAAYVLRNYRDIAFASVTVVGQAVNVSPATVVRFANHLGLSGYAELQNLTRQALRAEVDLVSRLQAISSASTPQSLFRDALQADIKNIQQAASRISTESFAGAVKLLTEADTIHIVGLRSIFGLAHHFFYLFREIGLKARLLSPGVGDVPEQILDITPSDVCVALSFRHYTRDTLMLFNAAREQGAKRIAITDSEVSPLAITADISLLVPVESPGFFESRAGTLSIISALALSVAIEMRESTLEALRARELIWKKLATFEPPHMRSRYDVAVKLFTSLAGRASKAQTASARRARKPSRQC